MTMVFGSPPALLASLAAANDEEGLRLQSEEDKNGKTKRKEKNDDLKKPTLGENLSLG